MAAWDLRTRHSPDGRLPNRTQRVQEAYLRASGYPALFPGSFHSEPVAQGETDQKHEHDADDLLEGAD